jgi:ABC-type glycerol-3-phosphate transport system substrate-binding protein
MDRGSDVEKLREAGMLVAFDDYLDKYPNLKTWLDSKGMNMLRSEDGKLYQFPNWYTSQPNGNAGYVVNKKIYTELGSPKIETTDDLYNYLKQVKEKYPNVIPFETGIAKDGQGLDQLYAAFKEDNKSFTRIRAVPTGDKLTSIFKDEPFRQSMVYSAKLFREKLMTQDAMTQTKDQEKEKIMTGRVAIYATASPTDIAQLAQPELAKADPNGGYIMIPPVHAEGIDPAKVFPGSFNQLGWNVSVITKAAKNPEAIFAFLDWYTGPEGQSVQMWGPPGEYWDGVDADGITPKFTDKYVTDADGLAKLQGETVNLMWNGNTVFDDKTKAKYEASLPEEKRSWATHWQSTVTWKSQSDATEFVNLDPMPESEEGIIRQRIEDIYLEARAKALFAKSDADVIAVLDKAEADAQTAGFDKLLAFRTTKWQENLKKMAGQ